MDIYRDAILDHYKHPRNFGHLKKPDAVVEEGNVTCGDTVVMEFSFTQDKTSKKRIVSGVRFSGVGCAISQASASMLTEKILGMEAEAVQRMTTEDILTMLGTTLTPSRIKCAVLPLEVAQKGTATGKKKT